MPDVNSTVTTLQGAPSSRIPLANFFALGAGELLSRAVAFVVTATLARRLGTEGFGALGFATAITTYLLVVPNLALQDLGGRAASRDAASVERIRGSVTRVRLLFGAVGVVAAFALALVLPGSATVRMLVVLNGLAVLPVALNSAWAYKAVERTRAVGVSLVLVQIVSLAGVLLLVTGRGDILRVPMIQAAGELIAALFLMGMAGGRWTAGSLQDGLQIVRGAGTIVVNRMLRAVIVVADLVLLGLMVDGAQVGLYSAAYRICFLLTAIAASAHVVFQPALLRAHSDSAVASRALTDALWMSWTIGAPLVTGGIVLAPDLLAFLFGEPYREGGTALRILLFSTLLLYMHGTMQAAFLARNMLALQTRIIGAAALLNVALNMMLIATIGIEGAATATAAAEALLLIATSVVLWKWHWRPDLRVLWKPLVSVGAMVICLWLGPHTWWLPARIALAGGAYAASLLLIGGMPRGFLPLRTPRSSVQ